MFVVDFVCPVGEVVLGEKAYSHPPVEVVLIVGSVEFPLLVVIS